VLPRHIVRSALWSLSGTVVPMVAALAAVPWLMKTLGQERLGVLSLVWVVVGYFSFLDMGLGRAVTVAVAGLRAHNGQAQHQELAVLGSACALLSGVGVVAAGGLAAALLSAGVPFALTSASMEQEVRMALLWTLPSLPLLLLSSALRGQLEGVGAFQALNLVRIPTGVLLVLGPCLSAALAPDLVWPCISILVVRVLHVGVLWHLVVRLFDRSGWALALEMWRGTDAACLRRLLAFGGWITVSNVAGPVIVYLDRFIIGITLAASAVAAYAVPFDLVARLPILVAALCSVLLPELSRLASLAAASAPQAAMQARRLVLRSSLVSAALVLPMVLLGAAATPWVLALWLGDAFAAQSTELTRILLFAFAINALAQLPFTALQALGRVRSVALLHVAELLPYSALLYGAISRYGLEGAAWAWLLRSAVDYMVLLWLWNLHRPMSDRTVKI